MAHASSIVDELERLTQEAFQSRHLRIEQYHAARALVAKLEGCASAHASDLPVDNIGEQIDELRLRLRRMFGQEPSEHGVQQEYIWVLAQLGRLRLETCFGSQRSTAGGKP